MRCNFRHEREIKLKHYERKQNAIRELFAFEEERNIPEAERLTYDPYAGNLDALDPSPRKKAYVDIRRVESSVDDLRQRGVI